MHPENPHKGRYDFLALIAANPDLQKFVFINPHKNQTIDFANPEGVFQLNRALLFHHYKLEEYTLPSGYLCPAVPGRVDYLCHLKTLLDAFGNKKEKGDTKVLDIGVGANCIYSIVGAQHFGWRMVGVDIHEASVESAQRNVNGTKGLNKKIEIRTQENNANIFNQTIKADEFFDITICNPPFHTSQSEAEKGTIQKNANLGENRNSENKALNFGGKANELWCNGGEALFIKRMIKQSITHRKQVGIFTTLVSKKAHLKKLYTQLDKANATHKTIVMNIGNKQSRILAWWFQVSRTSSIRTTKFESISSKSCKVRLEFAPFDI